MNPQLFRQHVQEAAIALGTWTIAELHAAVADRWAATDADVYRALRRLRRSGKVRCWFDRQARRYRLTVERTEEAKQ